MVVDFLENVSKVHMQFNSNVLVQVEVFKEFCDEVSLEFPSKDECDVLKFCRQALKPFFEATLKVFNVFLLFYAFVIEICAVVLNMEHRRKSSK